MVEFRLLGPLEIRVGQQWQAIGAPKWRTLLAALLCAAPAVVATERLVDELWGETPPAGARKLVSGYVLRLRQLIDDPAGQVLVTRPPGYALLIGPARLDLHRFVELVDTGLARGDADTLAAALELWRGPALAAVPVGPMLSAEVNRLTEAHADALAAYAVIRPVPAEEPSTDRSSGPRRLPAAVRHFAGRAGELKTLNRLLDDPRRDLGMVLISAIDGTAGVGKTALAVHWAHQVAERFPDGQLYVDLRGFGPSTTPVTPGEAIRGFLDALDLPPERIPADLDAQGALYRTVLADKRMLILLDNALDSAQVRPLVPGSAGCLVVVTSRAQLTGLAVADGAAPLTLDVLTDAEARELLGRRLSEPRLAAEPTATTALIALCARLPLALNIVAVRAAARPGVPLGRLAEELRDTRDRLDGLTTGEPENDLWAVFSWSYQRLGPAAARLFRLLGSHPAVEFSAPSAASLAGLDLPAAHRALRELAVANLLTEPAPGRYGWHDLLRGYAAEQSAVVDDEAERQAALHRVLGHYLHSAHAAERLLQPPRDRITVPPVPTGTTPEQFADHAEALDWCQAEYRALSAACAVAGAGDHVPYAWQLPWLLATFLDRRAYWRDWAELERTALAAAERAGDAAGQAHAHHKLGDALARLGDHRGAHEQLRLALRGHRAAGDLVNLAGAHFSFAWMFDRQAQPAEARAHAQRALTLYRDLGHQVGSAYGLNAVGWCHARLGNYEQTLTDCGQARDLARDLGDGSAQAVALFSLGYAYQRLDQHSAAVASYQASVELLHALSDRYLEAEGLFGLGDAHRLLGELPAARNAWRQALDIFEDIDHPHAEHLRTQLGRLTDPAPVVR
ncbi:MAG TPA: tetratricopeptide repeat protein [Pseudonocardiaceae bacterium]|nr:tetratricopeptide repeat protein [Pseudonocardiaceae bacterium]